MKRKTGRLLGVVWLCAAWPALLPLSLSAQELKLQETLKGHNNPVNGVAFSPDGKTLASGSGFDGPNELKLWDAATGKELATYKGEPDGDVVCSLAYSPDGKTLASSGWDDSVMLWDVKRGK